MNLVPGITEISMLATVAGSTAPPGNGQGGPLVEISDRARQMVHFPTLDEIVWAMNPKHDSLTSLVSYSCCTRTAFSNWPTSPAS